MNAKYLAYYGKVDVVIVAEDRETYTARVTKGDWQYDAGQYIRGHKWQFEVRRTHKSKGFASIEIK